MIKLYRSAENHSLGPILYINISNGIAEVCIKGYINIFGIAAPVNIELNNSTFSFEVSGHFWGILSLTIKVNIQYDGKGKNVDLFSVSLFIYHKNNLLFHPHPLCILLIGVLKENSHALKKMIALVEMIFILLNIVIKSKFF